MVPGGWSSQISRTHEGGKVVSPTHRPPLPQERPLVLVSVRVWVDPRAIVRPQRLSQWKIAMNPSGIETVTFRLVVHMRLRLCAKFKQEYLAYCFPENLNTRRSVTWISVPLFSTIHSTRRPLSFSARHCNISQRKQFCVVLIVFGAIILIGRYRRTTLTTSEPLVHAAV